MEGNNRNDIKMGPELEACHPRQEDFVNVMYVGKEGVGGGGGNDGVRKKNGETMERMRR